MKSQVDVVSVDQGGEWVTALFKLLLVLIDVSLEENLIVFSL